MKKKASSPLLLLVSAVLITTPFVSSRSHAMSVQEALYAHPMDKNEAQNFILSGVLMVLTGAGMAAGGVEAGVMGMAVGGITVGAIGLGAVTTGGFAITALQQHAALEKARNDALAYVDSGDPSAIHPLFASIREQVATAQGPEAAAAITYERVAAAVLAL